MFDAELLRKICKELLTEKDSETSGVVIAVLRSCRRRPGRGSRETAADLRAIPVSKEKINAESPEKNGHSQQEK
jgi:hypothetical protein